LVKLAIETAMRRGELLSLTWENVDLKRQTAHLPDTKNGDPRTVPLSTRAVAILRRCLCQRLTKRTVTSKNPTDRPVFPTTALALRKGFARAIERAQEQYRADCKQAKRRPAAGFLEDVHFTTHAMRPHRAWREADKRSGAVGGHWPQRPAHAQALLPPRAEDLAKKLG
jgi:integrase